MLGVTLVYSAAAAVIVTVASGGSFYIPWRDIFWTDYQTTDSFHSFIEARLYETPPPIPRRRKILRAGTTACSHWRPADGVLVLQHRRPVP
ncbi:MAG: hypothetical protein ACLRWQ_12950 [Flavonifractor plautii]